MSLQEHWQKIKPKAGFNSNASDILFDENGEVIKFPWIRKFFLTLLIILVGLLGFGVGKMTSLNQQSEIKIDYVDFDKTQNTVNSQPQTTNSSVTVSSKGTRYYYSWCKNTISEKNKVSFASAILAEKAGYTLAKNCSPR